MHFSRFQVTFYCNIPNFLAKLGSSSRSSKVNSRIRKPVCKLSKATKHLMPFVEFRGQSQPFFTNQLPNSEMDFCTSRRTSELRKEVRNITVKSYLKSTVSQKQKLTLPVSLDGGASALAKT